MSSSIADPSTAWRGLLDVLGGPLAGRVKLERQYDIDAARGIAILLVVLGHVVARDMPKDNHWYDVLKILIYRFHMPLFMVLTGISFALSLPKFESWASIARFSRQKASRLVVPYLFFGVLILVGKLVAAKFLHVDNPPQGSFDDVLALVLRPSVSVAGFLWFIYVLGLYYLALPALLQLTARRPAILFIAALACQFVDWPRVFLLYEAFAYLPYFVGGMLLWMVRDRWATISAHMTAAFVIAFSIALVLAMPLDLSKWLVGAFSVPAVLALAQRIPARWQHVLAWIGQLSLSIYLMTLMIGVAKAFLLKLMPWALLRTQWI